MLKRLMTQFRINTMQASVLMVILLGGVFSFYQVGSSLFACGKEYAGNEIRYWLIFSGIQGFLFLTQVFQLKLTKLYRLTQLIALPLVLIVLAQVAIAYSRIFIYIAFLIAFFWYAAWLVGKSNKIPLKIPNVGAAIAEGVVFVLLTIVIHSAITFVLLHSQGVYLSNHIFYSLITISALVAFWIVRTGPGFKSIGINQIPPFGLLIILILRAKFPDGAYDSLFYKATLPIMIADWRTAITGVMDHTLLGTNFFEIINSQLRILDDSYSPAMLSLFSFLGLWVLVPVAMASLLPKMLGWGKFAANTATLLLVSLSEMLIASGTAYHEPIIALFVVASLLALPVSWVFMAAAIAGKITVLFIVPFLIGLKLMMVPLAPDQIVISDVNDKRLLTRLKKTIRRLFFLEANRTANNYFIVVVCIILATIVVGEQFYRNIAYSGRLMGVSESLSSLTDPNGSKLASPQGVTVFDVVSQRGILEKVGVTFVHVLTLDRWIKPTELSFHVMPTSRMMAVVAMLAIFIVALPTLRRNKRLLALYIIWCICAFSMLNFFSQGRHLFPLSICAAILVAFIANEVLRTSQVTGNLGVKITFCLVVGFAAIGDQVVGTFINNAWECRRNIAVAVSMNNYDQPESPIERRLKEIISEYKILPASHHGVAPTILCESKIERMHYLGAHYIYAWTTYDLNLRHLAANPGNFKLLPTSLLAVCFTDPKFPEQILPPEIRSEFSEVQSEGDIRILISKSLMSGAKSTSLVGSQMGIQNWLAYRISLFDFIKNWEQAKAINSLPADTPSGKGRFISKINDNDVAFLVSSYGVAFEKIEFDKSSQIEVELGMYYSNTDGMIVEIQLEGENGGKQSERLDLKPKPESSSSPEWVKWSIPISPSIIGKGNITILAKSDGGSSTADWAVFRKFDLINK